MNIKLTALVAAVVFSTIHNNQQLLFVVSQQSVQPYFTEWNGSYYLFLYQPSGYVTHRLAYDVCQSDNGEVPPIITVSERDALLDDFFRASSEANRLGFVFLGADCSGSTCTKGGGVLDDSLWDVDTTSGVIVYPSFGAANNKHRALVWSKVNGRVQDRDTHDRNSKELICKYKSLCGSLFVKCLAGGACVQASPLVRQQCICRAGFEATPAKTNCIEIDECESNPCRSGGGGIVGGGGGVDTNDADTTKCIDEVNSYRCECIDGFSGERCEIAVADTDNVVIQESASSSSGDNSDNSTLIIVGVVGIAALALMVFGVLYMKRKTGGFTGRNAFNPAMSTASIGSIDSMGSMGSMGSIGSMGSMASIGSMGSMGSMGDRGVRFTY